MHIKKDFQKNIVELLRKNKYPLEIVKKGLFKGDSGRVTVIGGCSFYSGSPYFTAKAFGMIGGDLMEIITEKKTSSVIKSFDPDLMVYPILHETEYLKKEFGNDFFDYVDHLTVKTVVEESDIKVKDILSEFIQKQVLKKIEYIIKRSDIIVVGPGLGRDSLMLLELKMILSKCKEFNKSVVFDADGIYLVTLIPDIICGFDKLVFTPNSNEFKRLLNAFNIKSFSEDQKAVLENVKQLSKCLNNSIVIKKGLEDLIVKGDMYLINSQEGSPRRVGGQGDILAGLIAFFLNVAQKNSNEKFKFVSCLVDKIVYDNEILNMYIACLIIRNASKLAYDQYNVSVQSSRILNFLGKSYIDLKQIL